MLTYYVAAFVITALTHLALAVLVYLKGPRRLTHVTYALYAFSIAWWSGLEALAITTGDLVRALFLWRVCYLAVIFIPIFFVHFVISLHEPAERAKKQRLIRVAYVVGLGFLLLNATPLLTPEAAPKFAFKSFLKPGVLYPWFFALWMGWSAYGVFVLLPRLYVRSSGFRRIQLKYLCLSWLATYLGGVPNFLPIFNIEIPILMPFGTLAVPLNALVTAYVIARYRIMDIHVAITRTTVFMAVYALLLGLPLVGAWAWQPLLKQAMGSRWWVWLWVAAALLATAAHYANLYLQRRAEARLLREQRRYQETLLQASQGMTQVRELRRLLNLIIHVLTKTVGLHHAAIFLDEQKEMAFRLAAVRYRQDAGSIEHLPSDDPLIQLLNESRQPIVRDELKVQLDASAPTEAHLNRQVQVLARLQHLEASVIVPSLMEERLIGFLVLGEKRNQQLFTTEDLFIFSTLANQAAVSIENARFYEEERQRQAALFHAASLASLGTMASSMGHQVNNRFNVVSVIASIQMEKLKILLEQQGQDPVALHQALTECVTQFESLQEEALHGGRVVSAIRRIARPSPEGYQAISLASAIQAGIDVARYKVHLDELDFQLDVPGHLPKIYGDLAQLGECFLNLLDNASDAIKAKDQRLAEGLLQTANGATPFRGAIHIAAHVKHARMVDVRIADNGIGIAPEDLSKLFIPFYTTKATAEKGAGLGLYVIKQIVEAHGGTIRVESTPGNGTTVILELPIAQEISRSEIS